MKYLQPNVYVDGRIRPARVASVRIKPSFTGVLETFTFSCIQEHQGQNGEVRIVHHNLL